ncbi:MAG TPA: twin-arginine translocase subunit TatC [Gemmobacter sp.]|nr:twin-arginine translocase subunit TatC [Gemmobacter sp.]
MTEESLDDTAAPLVEHLAELRNRLIWSVVSFVAAMCVVFPFSVNVFNFLARPICDALAANGQDCMLQLISPQEGFFVAINISLFGGLILAFPVIAFQLWRFVAPGLYRQEKNALLPFLVASPVMFFLGATFAYYIVLPMAFGFFLTFQQLGGATPDAAEVGSNLPGIVFQGSAQEYLGVTMKFVLAFGLCFQLPVLLVLLGKAGIISSKGLAAFRKYAIVGILILAAVATPPDMMSQIMMFCAIYPLYEVSVVLIRMIEKKRKAQLQAEGLWDEDDEDAA